ncbi:hypothetical protein BT96DRAFT_980242, partial [Gymnopus androsaceus JB14]
MTPEESEQIASAVTVLFQNISILIFAIGLFGIYILAFTISMLIICRQRENNGWAHKAMIALLLAGFTVTTLSTCALIAFALSLVKFGLMVSLSGGVLAQEMAATFQATVPDILQIWSGNFVYLIADTAITWRAWALWAETRLIKLILLINLLADIGVNIADAVVDFKVISATFNLNPETLDWVGISLNLTVNIVATLLIAYRAWTHHQSTHAILRNKKTQVQAILLLMVESGAIFGVIQVIIIIIVVLDIHAAHPSPVEIANSFFVELYTYGAALNPVAILILIQTGNTYEHSFHLEDIPSLEINSVLNKS